MRIAAFWIPNTKNPSFELRHLCRFRHQRQQPPNQREGGFRGGIGRDHGYGQHEDVDGIVGQNNQMRRAVGRQQRNSTRSTADLKS